MCGIVGYVGPDEALPVLLNGLRRMEYRGYDSAGVAVLNGCTKVVKKPGKIANLSAALEKTKLAGTTGIGHTRWATHGAPTELNAHPHTSGRVTIVHNGIIENYAELKAMLASKHGRKFQSETDTEVLAALIDVKMEAAGDLEKAVLAALLDVEGTFGVLVLDEREPGKIVAARRGSPLLLGVAPDATYLASDATALVGYTNRVVYLDDDELVVCTPGHYKVLDFEAKAREHEEHVIETELRAIEKGGYDHFLLKEIMEQPETIKNVLRGRLDETDGTSHLGGLNLPEAAFRKQTRFLACSCGTAYYSGMLGKYQLERMTGIPTDLEFASEFRYRDPALTKGTISLFISQSGETADTLASLREVNRRGIPALGIVNVVGSSIAREVDGGIYLHAGPEVSVASTKAFTSMVVAQLLLGLHVGRRRSLSITEGKEIVKALQKLPAQVQKVLEQREQIKQIAKKYAKYENAMYLGRDSLYPVALEGALKLKEISYIHAEAYAAGEMKHGPIALLGPEFMIVYLMPRNALYDKSRSNLEEVRARGGRPIIIGTEGDESLQEFSDDVIYVPEASRWTEPILVNIPQQLLAYYIAVERGTDVDQPRNLAKSVTVE
jgi:glucosamine--fructose-6-phosphate aminotransferase (isomerizing)